MPRLLRRRLGRGQPRASAASSASWARTVRRSTTRRPRGGLRDPASPLRRTRTCARRTVSRAARRRDDPPSRDVRRSPHARVDGTDFATVGEIFSADAQRRPQEAVRHPLGDARRQLTRTPRRSNVGRLARRRHGRRVGRPRRRHPGMPAGNRVAAAAPGRASCRPTDRQRGRRARCSRSPRGRSPGPSTRPAATAPSSCSPICPASTAPPSRCAAGSSSTARRSAGRSRNFRGPIVFVVISRYHGGAFVVFSKALNPAPRGRCRGGLLRLRHRRRTRSRRRVRPRGRRPHAG